jgi:CRISPR-associated exonuclease Cas4
MARVAAKYISAGDLEKFSYCPLSWWLSAEFDGESEGLAEGVKGHEKLGKSLWKIEATEKTARESERLVLWWAIIATAIGIIGLELLRAAPELSEVLGVVALIWILAALYFLYKASRSTIHSKTVDYERIILVFAIVATAVAVSSVAFAIPADTKLALTFEAVAILWLIGASLFLYRTLKSTTIVDSLRKEFRVEGKIEYIDMDSAKAFRSNNFGLSGRPDYIIKLGEKLIPVEEKTGRTPKGPLYSHIIQVTAYCVLIEEAYGSPPPYGIVKYPEHEFEIEYNEDQKRMLLGKLAEMRKAARAGEAHRNHDRPGKCRFCSRREVCPEKLA